MSIEQRLASVERQLIVYKCIAAFSLLFFGSVALTKMNGSENDTKVIRANGFVLVDSDGKELGEWKADNSAPRLDLRSADGKRGVYLSVGQDAQQTTTLVVFGNENFASLSTNKITTGRGGYARLDVGNNNERAGIAAGNDLAPVFNLQQAGQVRVRAVAHPNQSSVAVIINGQEKKLEVP